MNYHNINNATLQKHAVSIIIQLDLRIRGQFVVPELRHLYVRGRTTTEVTMIHMASYGVFFLVFATIASKYNIIVVVNVYIHS